MRDSLVSSAHDEIHHSIGVSRIVARPRKETCELFVAWAAEKRGVAWLFNTARKQAQAQDLLAVAVAVAG
jgi:hypothetical protein